MHRGHHDALSLEHAGEIIMDYSAPYHAFALEKEKG